MSPTFRAGIMASQISGHLASILGTSWSAGGTMPSTADWGGTCFGNSMFYVGINATTTSGASSPTGVTWTSRSNPSTNISGIKFGNGIFMGFGYPNIITTSTDGITWSLATASGITNPGANAYGLSAFICSDGTTSAASTTNNGSSWTSRTTSSGVHRFAGSSSRVCGVPSSGSTTTATTNLSTWTSGTLPSSSLWYDVAYGNGIFVTVAYTSGTKSAYSSDGLSWTASTLPATSNWTTCIWGGANWIAVGNNGQAATSLDAITWTSRSISTLFALGIAVSPTVAVVTSYGGNTSQRSTS